MTFKNMYKLLLSFLLFSTILSCSKKAQSKLDKALVFAQSNRIELEYVLNHYSEHIDDSLKYKASIFLIENMPFHNYLESKNIDLLINEWHTCVLKNNLSEDDALSLLNRKYNNLQNLEYDTKNDAKSINASFLINNIDMAFKAWEEAPWRNQITFDQFCQEILPYRIGNEQPIEWRESYYNYLKPILDTIQINDDPIDACLNIYNILLHDLQWYYIEDLSTPNINGITLLKNRLGGCLEMTNLLLYAMRSMAIPGSIDMMIQHPDKKYRFHFWNCIKDTTDFPIDFILNEGWLRPIRGYRDVEKIKKGIIYRNYFGIQPNSLVLKYPNEDIPQRLKSPFWVNVSHEYYPNSYLNLELAEQEKEGSLLYLAVFNNSDWVPVAGAKIENQKVQFLGVEPDIVYCPVYYNNKKIEQATFPFIYNENGEIIYLYPDINNTVSVKLTRKYPLSVKLQRFKKRAIGGKFQGANFIDFRDATTLYTIKDSVELNYLLIDIHDKQQYRYVRYLSPDSSCCNMAEIEFFNSKKEIVNGTIIGSSGSLRDDENRTKYAVFDNDPLTFFDSSDPSGSWVGLDLGIPQRIFQIQFLFRNDDNMIRKGDHYELFYFTNKEKISLGKQIAQNNQYLVFEKVPNNALLLLHNHTRGEEERIFTYENGNQVWW